MLTRTSQLTNFLVGLLNVLHVQEYNQLLNRLVVDIKPSQSIAVTHFALPKGALFYKNSKGYTPSRRVGLSTISLLDSVLGQQYNYGLLMGSVLVAQHGQVVYRKEFGYQDVANKIPISPAAGFALASISKQFTSTAILQLIEKNKLRLDDPFATYFPDFPFKSVTVQHLLCQTSGLPEYELFDQLIETNPKRVFTNQDIIPALKQWAKGLYFQPGEAWHYSSINYCLLALLVEKRSGKGFQQYLTEFIFKPAGMNHTYLENYLVKTVNAYRTKNYEYPTYYASRLVDVDSIQSHHKMIYNLGGFYGQGGLTSTASDLLLFDNAFFGGKLISTHSIKKAFTPVRLTNGKVAEAYSFGSLGHSGYGMGWFVLSDTTNGTIVWHDGSRPGISTVHFHNLRTDQTTIVLENMPQDGNGTAISAYNIVNGKPYVSPQVCLIQLYGQTLVEKGPVAAIARLTFLRQNSLYKMPYDFMWLNLGYQLLDKEGYADLSVETFKVASLLFPDAWYLSLGLANALDKSGKRDEAILLVKTCLSQNPGNEFAQRKLRELEAK